MDAAPLQDRLRSGLSDRYAIERELGRGGMASVWLASIEDAPRFEALLVMPRPRAPAGC